MAIMSILLATAAILLAYLWYQTVQLRRRYPDGPTPLPIIGNIHQVVMAGNIVNFLEENRKKYGNIFTVVFGGDCRIVVNGLSVFNELLVKHAAHTSNRDGNSLLDPKRMALLRREKRTGILWSSYPTWKDMRTFALVALREEGMGRQSLEPRIHAECQAFIKTYIEPKVNQPVDLTHSFSLATANIISAVLFGKRFEYDNPEFLKLIHGVHRILEIGVKAVLFRSIPFSRYLPNSVTSTTETAKIQDEVFIPIIRRHMKEHHETLDKDNPRDLIDQYLIAAESEAEEKSGDNLKLEESQLLPIITQLYAAGTDTTSRAVAWALLFTCKHQNVQAKIREELRDQIGFDRLPSFKDRLHMPYTTAVLNETLRVANIVPTALPHTLDKELVIEGKVLPAGSELMLNMASCLWDPSVFSDENVFKPERFIGEGSAQVAYSKPFGIGRRMCLGESFARMEFFLFYTSIMQKFSLRTEEGVCLSAEPVVGLTSHPKPFNIIFTPTNS